MCTFVDRTKYGKQVSMIHNMAFFPCSMSVYLIVLCLCPLQDTASLGSQKGGFSKHGWLYKGNMNSAISVTMRVRHRIFNLNH